jgi:AcrR family transcriptional regulator
MAAEGWAMARNEAAKRNKVEGAGRAPREQPLTPEIIVDAALRIGDVSGIEGITTRRLGEELGCAHTAVYLHFPSRDALLKAVFDRALARAPHAVPKDGPWEERARAICASIRRTLLDHPVCYPLAQRFPGRGVGLWAEDMARVAADAGYGEEERYAVERLLSEVAVGMTSNTAFRAAGVKAGTEHEQARAEERPLLREYAKIDDEVMFAAIVECVIDGLRRGLRVSSPGAGSSTAS